MIAVLVALFGGVGAATRFVADGWFRGRWSRQWPVATAAINVSGSLLIGVLAGALAVGNIPPNGYVLAASGFCGGFTTFSTAMIETVRLIQAGDIRGAVASTVGPLVAAVGAAAAGFWLATL